MNRTEKELHEFNYLEERKVREILDTFKLLEIDDFGPYKGAMEFTKDMEPASNLHSQGIEYCVSTSSTSTNRK